MGRRAKTGSAETSALAPTAPIKRGARFHAADVHENNPNNRAENGDTAEDKGINDRRRAMSASPAIVSAPIKNRADQTDRVGFKNVRRHAGAIADVVAHVVRDRGRIARIVFVEIALDFADEIRADVRRFGVNAAAQTRENTDQTGAQREADQTANRRDRGRSILPAMRVENRDREKRQTDHKQVR